VLSAPEYAGGHLDWHSFDVDARARASHGLGVGEPESKPLELLPVPLAYAGMPASRWWELEAGAVYFGGSGVGGSDLIR